jgi:HEAT repeat protein
LIKALSYEGDRSIRKNAAQALGELGDPRAVKPLIAALDEFYYRGEEVVVEALIQIGEPAVDHLITALNEDDRDVRKRAVEALGEIGDPRAVEPFKVDLALVDISILFLIIAARVFNSKPRS